MKQRFSIRPQRKPRLETVPQILCVLEEVLEATEVDVGLNEAAQHVRRAIDAIDCARALALAVMREAEAETEPYGGYGVAHGKLC